MEAAPEAAGNTILVNGVAKTYEMTRRRLGWIVGPEAPIKTAANLQSHFSSYFANVPQIAGLVALTGDQSDALAT